MAYTSPDELPLRKWTCGEADWLSEVHHADPRLLALYPRRFTAREVLTLNRAGFDPVQVHNDPDAAVDYLAAT